MPDPVTGGAAIAAGGGILGGLLSGGGGGSKSAARKQAQAATDAIALEREMFEYQKEALAPWREQGTKALNYLSKMIEAGPGGRVDTRTTPIENITDDEAISRAVAEERKRRSGLWSQYNQELSYSYKDPANMAGDNYGGGDSPYGNQMTRPEPASPYATDQDITQALFYDPASGEWKYPTKQTGGESYMEAVKSTDPYGGYEKSPYYNFLVSEGAKGLERGAAAKGMQFSGAEQKALIGYEKDMASTDYDTWLNNWYRSLTPWQSLAGMGQTAVNSTNNAAQNYAAGASQNILNAGNARAAGQLGQQNTWGNLLNWGGQQVGNYLTYNSLLNQNRNMYGQSGGGGGGGGVWGGSLY